LSYKQGLEYILRHDTSPLIRVVFYDHPGQANLNALPKNEAKRIVVVNKISDADYWLTAYTMPGCVCESYDIKIDYHTFYVHSMPIMSIIKLH
jgi:hypothetical protein